MAESRSTEIFHERIEVFESKLHGRGIRAKKDLKPGDVLMQDTPFSYVLYHNSPIQCCDYCFTDHENVPVSTGLKKCTGCQFVRYCDKKCQKAAWPDHKLECKVLRTTSGIPDRIRLLAKTQWNRKRLYDDNPSIAKVDKGGFPNDPDNLTTHLDKWEGKHVSEFEEFVFPQLSQFMRRADDSPDKDTVKRLFDVDRVNGEEIPTTTKPVKWIGYGLWLKSSLFNHQCDSNCYCVFDGLTKVIRALKDIKKGDECFVSYVDAFNPTAERQLEIKTNWHFTCNCALCQDKERDARICGLRCGNSKCSSAAPFHPVVDPVFVNGTPCYQISDAERETKCLTCSWSPDIELRRRYGPAYQEMSETKKLLNKLTSNPSGCDWSVVKELSERCLSIGEPLFHRHNQVMMYFMSTVTSAYAKLYLYEKYVDNFSKIIKILRETSVSIYHQGFALEYVELARIYNDRSILLNLSDRQRMIEAAKWLQQALELLPVTHGEDHHITKTARKHLINYQTGLTLMDLQTVLQKTKVREENPSQ